MKHRSPRPKKHLGQHFLADLSIPAQLLEHIAPLPTDVFIEIGPGLGALTIPLLQSHVTLYGLEFDQEVIPTLLQRTHAYPQFQCIQGDATCFNYAAIFQQHPNLQFRVVGNLPYNVSTVILFQLWTFIDSFVDMTFMLQKEVVDRMIAKPGERDYGRLAMMTHYFCNPEPWFTVPPSCFNPPPRVNSQFITLIPRPPAERVKINPQLLSEWTKRLFQFPRKTVWNNLKASCTRDQLEAADINPQDRPQEITLHQLVTLIKNITL